MTRVRLGISTCPNDTFAFHGLMSGEVRAEGLELEFALADVEELNERLLAGSLDVSKVSFHAALAAAERLVVLPAGSALGFGVGPLVLGAPGRDRLPAAGGPPPRVLSPGALTTAALLWRIFHPGAGVLDHVRFDRIPPALQTGQADYGICIHEARFTYGAWGLELVEDLGATWQQHTACPLPLGGIAARADLGPETLGALADAVARSVRFGRQNPEACLPTMRAHAQEQADTALWKHVELYVNDWTEDLGSEGRRALGRLGELAEQAGLVPPGARLTLLPSRGEARR